MQTTIEWTDWTGSIARTETVHLDDELLNAIAYARREVLERGNVIAAVDGGETVEWQIYLDGSIAYVDGSLMDYASEPVTLTLPETIAPPTLNIVYAIVRN